MSIFEAEAEPINFDPELELEKQGIPIQYLHLRDVLAAWDAERCKVYCSIGLKRIQKRSALCHELAHITLQHNRCAYPDTALRNVSTIAQERSAELWAARRLINVVQLAAAQESGLPHSIVARELGVTERMYRARLIAEREDERRWLGLEVSPD
ncbi:ImmA/IrrE family metallo-endopeptidase [Streptomyces sp. NPDC090442]|uniref:ImmA/IrrE family metallo-endopeptidase n=1 Tax=Streptomyces sp. NPDC090442 TaxID=3365962 RepID=UPI0037F7A907